MSHLSLICPHCQARLSGAQPERVKPTVTCPRCRQRFAVTPTLPVAPPAWPVLTLERAEPEAPAPPSLWRWVLLLVLLPIALSVGVVAWAMLGEANPAPDDKARTEAPPPVVVPPPVPAPRPEPPLDEPAAPKPVLPPPVEEPKRPDEPRVVEPVVREPAPTKKERAVVGKHIAEPGAVPALLARAPGSNAWKRIAPESPVLAGDLLTSLPGFSSDIEAPGGVRLTLHGHVPEYAPYPPLMDYLNESTLLLRKTDAYDLDLTLERGRIYLANRKSEGAAKVRLRFVDQEWEVTLAEPSTEVVLDLPRYYVADSHWRVAEPLAQALFGVVRGQADLKATAKSVPHKLVAAPGQALFLWNNFQRKDDGPHRLKKALDIWDREPLIASMKPAAAAQARRMSSAVKDLGRALADSTSPEAALKEALSSQVPSEELRGLAIYGLGAIDDIDGLIEVLGENNPKRGMDRDRAIFALRRWISRGTREARLVYDDKTRTGALVKRGYRPTEAETALFLLHDLHEVDRHGPEPFEMLAHALASPKVGIAELAVWHLNRLVQPTPVPGFNAADELAVRKKAADKVRQLVQAGKLPQPAPKTTEAPKRDAGPPSPLPVLSGKLLNDLLRAIHATGKRLEAGPNIAIAEGWLKHITLTNGSFKGHIATLRGGPELRWPATLREGKFEKDSAGATRAWQAALKQLKDRERPAPASLRELRTDLKALQGTLLGNMDDLSAPQYLEARRFLNHLEDGLRALEDPLVINYYNGRWSASGRNVLELVRHMQREKLQFAAAGPGDEPAYFALYEALRTFEMGLHRGKR